MPDDRRPSDSKLELRPKSGGGLELVNPKTGKRDEDKPANDDTSTDETNKTDKTDKTTSTTAPATSASSTAKAPEVSLPLSMERRCPRGWIESYIEFTINTESPDVFHVWTAVATIAAALRHSVYMDRQVYTLYPNHYIMLVAESGRCRKSTALSIGPREFLSKLARTNMIAGTVTSAGLFDAMRKEVIRNGRPMQPDGSIFVLASELTYSLHEGTERDRTLRMLTDMYDGKVKTDDVTRGLGRQQVSKANVNFFGATTPKSLTEVITSAAVGIGLIGRTLWIYGDKPRKPVAWPELTARGEELKAELLHDLKIIAMLKGEVKVSAAAREFYREWYETELKSPDDASTDYEREYLARKGDHVLKLAIVLMVNHSNELLLKKRHIDKALKLLAMVERDMWRSFKLVGTDTSALLGDIIHFLSKKPSFGATFSQLIAQFKTRIKRKEDLQSAIDMGREEGLIIVQAQPTQKRILFSLSPHGMEIIFGKQAAEAIKGGSAAAMEARGHQTILKPHSSGTGWDLSIEEVLDEETEAFLHQADAQREMGESNGAGETDGADALKGE